MNCVRHFRILRWTAIIGRTPKVSVRHTNQQNVFLTAIREIPDMINDHEPKQYHLSGA
jgi:hypothetical protein